VIHHAKSGNFYIISIDIGTSSAKALSRSTAS
jgi:sugar (pentulose or hexulose) kinase